ncbi:MAG: aminopeptidase [Candidatus Binatia bacterium]
MKIRCVLRPSCLILRFLAPLFLRFVFLLSPCFAISPFRRFARPSPWLLTFGLLPLVAACSPTYVLRAGYEEAKILWNRRPIVEVLNQPDLDAATREKLELVLQVRQFTEKDLGFRVGGSYSSITELANPPIVYVVTAAPRTQLEPYTWWFPIIGRVAYKGYFSPDDAKQEAQRLEAQGYDTFVRTASAFSTLGWFSDPLLPHLLKYDLETLANIVIHELFHTTFYLNGQSAFNESLANFAGHRGVIAFFIKEQGAKAAAVQQAQATWESELAISNFLNAAAERLRTLYASPLSEEEKLQQRGQLFTQVQAEFRKLPRQVRRGADLASLKLNNAVILQYLVYLQDLATFERIYQQNGADLRKTLTEIERVAEQGDDPFVEVRKMVARSSGL